MGCNGVFHNYDICLMDNNWGNLSFDRLIFFFICLSIWQAFFSCSLFFRRARLLSFWLETGTNKSLGSWPWGVNWALNFEWRVVRLLVNYWTQRKTPTSLCRQEEFELLITFIFYMFLLLQNPYWNRCILPMRFSNLKRKLKLRSKYNQICEGIHRTIWCNIEYLKALAIISTHDCMFSIF